MPAFFYVVNIEESGMRVVGLSGWQVKILN